MQLHKLVEDLLQNVIESEYLRVQEDNFSDINDAERKELEDTTSKMIELEQQIFLMLSKEGRELYSELESLSGTRLCIESRYMFKKGVVAGLNDLEYLKEASNYVYLPLIKL